MLLHRYLLIPICILFTITGLPQNRQDTDSRKLAKADSLFASFSRHTPGVSVGVMRDGKPVFVKGYGLANLEYDIPVTESTPFHAASLSKQFTAFCILLLQQKGLFALDDDIRKFIPEMPLYEKPITLRMLATHTSGLRDQWRLLEMAGWRLDDVIKKDQVLRLACRQKRLNFSPGEKYQYCNTGFTLLAEVVERVSGTSLSAFARANIFDVAGMVNTAFVDDYESIYPGKAYSYSMAGNSFKKNNLNYSVTGATGLQTTAADMLSWARFLNTPSPSYEPLVTILNTQALLTDGTSSEAALGQFTGPTFHGMQWFDHSGSDAGFRSYLGRFPQHGAAVVVLANVIPINATNLALSLADIFLNDLYSTAKKPVQRSVFIHNPELFISLPKEKLEQFSGKYWQPDAWYDREIRLVNDTLTYIRPGGKSSKLLPVTETEFKMLDDLENVSVVFAQDKNPAMKMIINTSQSIPFVKYNAPNTAGITGKYYSDELQANYAIILKGNKLFATNIRRDDIELTQVTDNLLTSANRNFKKLSLIRNSAGIVQSIIVDNDGASGVVFERQDM